MVSCMSYSSTTVKRRAATAISEIELPRNKYLHTYWKVLLYFLALAAFLLSFLLILVLGPFSSSSVE